MTTQGSLVKSILNPIQPTLVGPFLIRFIPLLLLVVLFAAGYYLLKKTTQEAVLQNRQFLNVEFLVSTIQLKLRNFVHDFGILAGHQELRDYLATGDATSKKALEQEYLVHLENSDRIDQIRLLDFSGNEIIRVNFAAGNPKVVKSEDLQSKAGRYYFQSVKQLPSDYIYVSPLDLNIEHGELEYPLKPMLRLGTVVSPEDNDSRNILMVNFLGDVLLQLDFPGVNGDSEQLLVNSNGFYLKGPDPKEEWGRMFEERKHFNFGTKYPGFWQAILGSDSGQIVNAQGLMTYKKIVLLADSNIESTVTFEDPDYHWILISLVPPEILLATDSLNDVLMASLGSLLALAFICFQTARSGVEEVRSKDLLQKSENQYRELVETAQDLIWRCDTEGRVFYLNPAWERTHGYTIAEILGRPFTDFLVPSTEERVLEDFENVLAGQEIIGIEQTHLSKSGEQIHLVVNAMPTRDTQGNIVGLHGTAVDITQREQAESSLKESESRYRSLADNSPEIIWRINPQGILTYISPVVKELSGFEPDELIGIHIGHLFSDQDSETNALETLNQRLQGDFGSDPIVYELQYPRKDGSSYLAEIRSAPILDESGKIIEIQGTTRDITVRKQMENELLKIQKLESVGILAGGVAHDLNNFLTAIMGNLSLARISDHRAERERFLDNTEKALVRLKDLTQQLLTFSKGGMPILDTRDIRALLEDCTNFSLRGSNVACELTLSDDLSLVNIDAGQINQVVSNLIINARQAMQTGGTIKISARNYHLNKQLKIPLAVGAYVKVAIEDEGTGIEEEDLPHIFDPFFTTKDFGSGLGLATSYAIIQKHNGHISVESQVGKGTKFEIYLPVSKQSQPSQETDKQIVPVKGEGRILLMDDEEDIRVLAQAMLSKLGYDVSVAKDGDEVIELYKMALKSNQPYRAVILDLTIPGGMGGKETIEKLQAIDPQVMAIVSSGYATDRVMNNYQDYGFSGILIKPYFTAEMSTVLQDVLSTDHHRRI